MTLISCIYQQQALIIIYFYSSQVARGRTDFCAAHGGGIRCSYPECYKAAISKLTFCRAHCNLNANDRSKLSTGKPADLLNPYSYAFNSISQAMHYYMNGDPGMLLNAAYSVGEPDKSNNNIALKDNRKRSLDEVAPSVNEKGPNEMLTPATLLNKARGSNESLGSLSNSSDGSSIKSDYEEMLKYVAADTQSDSSEKASIEADSRTESTAPVESHQSTCYIFINFYLLYIYLNRVFRSY
jgi:hypothetical protein